MRSTWIVVMLTVGVSLGCGGAAQTPPEAPPPPDAGTPDMEPAPPAASGEGDATGGDQVARGAALYGEKCASCHGDQGQGQGKAPAVVGSSALPLDPPAGAARKTQFKTAADVIAFVQQAMPPKEPGSLTEQQASDVVAFALKANGVDVTGKTIDMQSASQIVLHP
jgi:cytochrome c